MVVGIDYNPPPDDEDGQREEVRLGFPPLRAAKRDAEEFARVLAQVPSLD